MCSELIGRNIRDVIGLDRRSPHFAFVERAGLWPRKAVHGRHDVGTGLFHNHLGNDKDGRIAEHHQEQAHLHGPLRPTGHIGLFSQLNEQPLVLVHVQDLLLIQ